MIKFTEVRDGKAMMASNINGYGYLLEHLLAEAEITMSGRVTKTLELDPEASMDYFTGESLYNVYKTPDKLLTEVTELVVSRNGVDQVEEPIYVDWLAGRIHIGRSDKPLTVKATYTYVKKAEIPTGSDIPILTVEDTPLYWPTMADLDENGTIIIRGDGKGKYLITASPAGEVSAVKVVTEVVDNLQSDDPEAALSARQGRLIVESATQTGSEAKRMSTLALLAEPPSIDPAIVRDLMGCVMTYMNHSEELTIGNTGTLFDPDLDRSKPYIDNSALVQACIQGISYEYSRYTASDNTSHFKYGVTLPDNPYGEGRYTVGDLASYLQDNGCCFAPNIDCSNISPGDLIFIGTDKADKVEVTDVLIVVGYKDPVHLTCIRAAERLEFYDLIVDSLEQPRIILAARPAYNPTVGLDPKPVINDSTLGSVDITGTLKTYTLPIDLKTNMPYTLVARINHVLSDNTTPVALIATYADYTTSTLCSWANNKVPKDSLYYMKFITSDKPVIRLTIVVDGWTGEQHSVELVQLYEGLVRPTKLLASPRDRHLYTRLPEASACYRGQIAVLDNGSGVDAAYMCLHVGDGNFKWFGLDALPTNTSSHLGLGLVGSLTVQV